MEKIIGYTTGVFDMFHQGHLNILTKAREHCDYLIVGVTTDELCYRRKGHYPKMNYDERVKMLSVLNLADSIVPQAEMNKFDACKKYGVKMLFVGDDWKGTEVWDQYIRELNEINVQVEFIPYTRKICSSYLKKEYRAYELEFDWERNGYRILKYNGNEKKIVLKEQIGLFPIVSIFDQAFAFSTVESMVIGRNVASIGTEAFFGCRNLREVKIPEGVQEIGKGAFAQCYELESVNIPSTVSVLQSYVFWNCRNLKRLEQGKSILRICERCFSSDVPVLEKEGSVCYWLDWCIGTEDRLVQSIEVRQGIAHIADAAFLGCRKLKEVKLPDTIKSIGSFSFDGTILWKESVEDGVIYVGDWAIGLSDDLLLTEKIVLRESVIGIGDQAFAGARFLKIVDGLKNVKYMGRKAFAGCEAFGEMI